MLAYFFAYDCRQHSLLPLPIPQALTWWQGLEEAYDGLVYLHGYADRKLGQHKGIRALEAATGTLKWEATELAFYGLCAEGLLAYPAASTEHAYQLLNAATGQVLQQAVAQDAAVAVTESFSRSRYAACQYPVLYPEGEPYFAQVQAFIAAQLGTEALKAIEYVETDAALVVSYYTGEAAGKLDNYLAVFNFEGDLQLHVSLGSSLSGIGSDTFFIFKHKLYFIRNKDVLQVYSLLL